jgi:hypothetical protein
MENKPLVTPIDPRTLNPETPVIMTPTKSQAGAFYIFVIVVIAGIIAGYFLSRGSLLGASKNANMATGKDMVNTANEIGSTDTGTFKDNATGVLEAGGIKGEGTHKLVRDGGPSQTVYLVSSVVDLDTYVGKKVQVWGQTLKAKYAGWLMDVGRLKILE